MSSALSEGSLLVLVYPYKKLVRQLVHLYLINGGNRWPEGLNNNFYSITQPRTGSAVGLEWTHLLPGPKLLGVLSAGQSGRPSPGRFQSEASAMGGLSRPGHWGERCPGADS